MLIESISSDSAVPVSLSENAVEAPTWKHPGELWKHSLDAELLNGRGGANRRSPRGG